MLCQIAETLLTAQGKTAGFSIPSAFVFIPLALSLCHSPPTVVFAPIVTTQRPALTPADWWISCDGGGLSVRALSASKQLSFPIRIPSTAEERAGAASAQDPKTKTFDLWMSSLSSATRPARQGATKDLNIHQSGRFFYLLSFFFRPALCFFDQLNLK